MFVHKGRSMRIQCSKISELTHGPQIVYPEVHTTVAIETADLCVGCLWDVREDTRVWNTVTSTQTLITNTHTHTHTHTHKQTYTHQHQLHKHTHIHTQAHTHIHMHTPTPTTQTHTHTHSCMQTHSHALTHTHTITTNTRWLRGPVSEVRAMECRMGIGMGIPKRSQENSHPYGGMFTDEGVLQSGSTHMAGEETELIRDVWQYRGSLDSCIHTHTHTHTYTKYIPLWDRTAR